MKAATVNDIRKELQHQDADILKDICLRLIKYKKENKELVTYLLYESHDEPAYIEAIKEEMKDEFKTIKAQVNAYYIKKTLRKILRWVNRQVRYSGVPETEIEIRIEFCALMKSNKIPMHTGTVLSNIYYQQVKKIKSLLANMPEDKQGDFRIPV
jgi:hypothetical protein